MQVQANGIQIHTERFGQGTPLILIPGFTNHSGMWKNFIPSLSKHFEVITFDNRGSGRSDAPEGPYTIDLLADDLAALMEVLSITKAHLVGFSMGSCIVQSMMLRHSKKVLKGVLLAPFNTLPSTAKMQAETTAKLFQMGIEPKVAMETIFPWIFSNAFLSKRENIDTTINKLLNDPHPQPPEGYAGQLSAIAHFDLTIRLPEIEKECLLIAGEDDLYTPLYTVKILEEKISNTRLVTLPKIGHMVHIEKEDQCLEEIHAFCKSE